MLPIGQTSKSREMSPESVMKPAPSMKLRPSTTPSSPVTYLTITGPGGNVVNKLRVAIMAIYRMYYF